MFTCLFTYDFLRESMLCLFLVYVMLCFIFCFCLFNYSIKTCFVVWYSDCCRFFMSLSCWDWFSIYVNQCDWFIKRNSTLTLIAVAEWFLACCSVLLWCSRLGIDLAGAYFNLFLFIILILQHVLNFFWWYHVINYH